MCVLHVRDYRFAYDPAPVDIAVVCCSMGSRESEIRFCYARSTALVCRARRNSCFPLTLSAVASLESPRETTSRIYKGERASFPTYLPIYIYISTYLPTYLPTHLPTYLPIYPPIYLSICLVSFRLKPSRHARRQSNICIFPLVSLVEAAIFLRVIARSDRFLANEVTWYYFD